MQMDIKDRHVILIPLMLFLFCVQANALEQTLPEHLMESGLVTRGEQEFAQRWFDGVTSPTQSIAPADAWLNTELPFSFKYDGKEFAALRGQWSREKRVKQSDSMIPEEEIIWTDAPVVYLYRQPSIYGVNKDIADLFEPRADEFTIFKDRYGG